MSAHNDELAFLNPNLIEHTAVIVRAYVGNNRGSAGEVASLVKDVHATLAGLARPGSGAVAVTTQKPAVSVKKSITPEYVICLEDGKKLRMLKRYLRSRYGLSPEQYRAKWSLPMDYPMTAPNYAANRSAIAKQFKLGHRAEQVKQRKRT